MNRQGFELEIQPKQQIFLEEEDLDNKTGILPKKILPFKNISANFPKSINEKKTIFINCQYHPTSGPAI